MRITIADFNKIEHPARKPGHRLVPSDCKTLNIKVLNPTREHYVEIYGPQQKLLAVLIKKCLDPDLVATTYKLLRTVNGDPKNRPGIIGEGARQMELRKDGSVSNRSGTVSPAVLKAYGGKTDMLGYYYYRASEKCSPTGWTIRKPDLYRQVLPFVHAVNDVYKTNLPAQYAKQLEYVNTVDEEYKIEGTAFSTLYVLRNAPTANHVDKFDHPGAFGVMATLGAPNFIGGEICFLDYGIAIDYRPGDVLLADVHQLHGNFPVLSGERVSTVLFVRKEIHKCPV